MSGATVPSAPTGANDDADSYLHRPVLTGTGATDTRKHSGGDYATITLADIIGKLDEPSALPKEAARYIIPSSYVRGGGDDDARSHAAQRKHGTFTLICLDVDKGNLDRDTLDDAITRFFGDVFLVIFSTASAVAQDRRWRVIVPLEAGLSFPEWDELSEVLHDFMQSNGIAVDRSLRGPAQPVFLPNVPPNARDADGKPLFYESIAYRGHPAFRDAPEVAKAIRALRDRREAEDRIRGFAKAEAARRRAERAASGQESALDAFNARNSIADLLAQYDYEPSPRSDSDWRSPHQTSGSFATKLFEDGDGAEYWVSLSASDAEAGLGAMSTNGARFGDAFDLYAHFEHDGDFQRALSGASALCEVVPNAPAGPVPLGRAEVLPSPPAPLPGAMELIVKAGLEAAPKPQPSLMTLAALIAMASACDGHYHLPSGLRLNLYGIGLAPTGAGKDMPQQAAKAVAEKASVMLLGESGSGQGLEDGLMSHRSALAIIDELAHMLAAAANAKAPPHLKALEGMYLKLFSASASSHTTRQLAGRAPKTIHHPCLNLLGYATPEKLGEALGEGNITSGLLGRMLMAVADDGVHPRRAKGRFALPGDVEGVVSSIANHVLIGTRHGSEHSVCVEISEEADDRLQDLLESFNSEMEAAQSEAGRALLARSYEKAERIAGVLAVWASPAQPQILEAHVVWAEAFVRSSDAATLWFLKQHMHGGQIQANAAKVMRITEKVLSNAYGTDRTSERKAIAAGYAPRTLVLRKSKLDVKSFDLAVSQLVAQGDLVSTTYPIGSAGKGIAVLAFPVHR